MSRWSSEEESEVILFYRSNRVLWDPKDKLYFCRATRARLFKVLETIMFEVHGKLVNASGIKDKWKNLRATHTRERKKIKATAAPGAGTSSSFYTPRWCHFVEMDFLHDLACDEGEEDILPDCVADAQQTLNLIKVESGEESWESSQQQQQQAAEDLFHDLTDESGDDTEQQQQQQQQQSPPTSTEVRPTKKKDVNRACAERTSAAAYVVTKRTTGASSTDDCDKFAEHVAIILRGMPLVNKERCKLEIQQILVKYVEKEEN